MKLVFIANTSGGILKIYRDSEDWYGIYNDDAKVLHKKLVSTLHSTIPLEESFKYALERFTIQNGAIIVDVIKKILD